MKIYIFLYHFINTNIKLNDILFLNEKRYFINLEKFEKQMEYLCTEFNIPVIGFNNLDKNKIKKGIIITFDDGHKSIYNHAYPILKKYKIPATIFMTTNYIDKPNYLSTRQLEELSQDPLISIQSHSVSHPFMDDLSENEAIYELSESKHILENLLGKEVFAFALPGGRIPKNLESIARKCGYRYVCTSIPGVNTKPDFFLKRIDIQRHFDLEQFKKIFESPAFLYKLKFKYFSLYSLKKILGNHLYLQLRKSVQAVR